MKKICGFFVFLCVAVSVFVYAVEEKDGYLYGDLSIAYNNELPSGLFAKSRNYLPGDTLHISNPFTGEEINVLNLSSLDEDSESILMLTTEAANKLGIDFKNPLYVRVSPRTNDFDEIAAGSAMLTYNKDAAQTEAPPLAQKPKAADDEPKAPPVQEPVKTAEVAAAPEPEKKEEPPVAQAEAKNPEPVPEPKAEVAAVPKVEPVADLSTLADPLPVAKQEPVEIVQQPVELAQQPVKKEEPVAEKPVNEPEPEKKSEPVEFAEETLVRTGKGRKSYTTVTTVSETVTDGAALAAYDEDDGIEEIAVKQKKKKAKKASAVQPVYEEPVAQLSAGDDAGLNSTEPLTAEENKGLALAEKGFEIPAVHPDVVSEVIPEITEESVKLASNGLKEVPSASLAVVELPANRSVPHISPDDAVYEYSQTHSSDWPTDVVEEEVIDREIPVSFAALSSETAVSEPDAGQKLRADEPAVLETDVPIKEIPVLASYTSTGTSTGTISSAVDPEASKAPVVSAEPIAETVYKASVKKSDEPLSLPETVVQDTAVSHLTPAEPAEQETELSVPPVPPLAQKTSLTKAEPQQLAPEVIPEEKKVEVPVRVETPKKVEPPKQVELPKKTEAKKKTASPKKTEKKAVAVETAAAPKKSSEKKEVKVAAKKESKPVPKKKEVKASVNEEDSSEDEELIYSQTDELMLIPSGGWEQKTYSGESSSAGKKAKDEPKKQPEKAKAADTGSEDNDSDNIIVNKQDVFTLSPTDSIGPDGRQGDGQRVYTPQKPEPKAASSSAPAAAGAGAGKSAGNGKSASAAKPAAPSKAADAVREKDLKAGNYIQFATCTTDAEAEKIISKYNKYPIIKVPFEGRAGYKLLVGPLREDEKGAVLVRFKAFGFSDAYLRKVQ